MKRILFATLLFAIATPLSAQSVNLDFPGLSEKAKEVVDITLDGDMLRLASKFLSRDDADERAIHDVVNKLTGLYVRSYSFDREGEYDRSSIARLRTSLGPSWKKIVDVRSKLREDAEIYVDTRGGSPSGLLIISAEPRELTIVNIVGPIDLDQLSRLEGQFGIPRMSKEKEKEKNQ
jgi:hypothetical protein